MITTDINTFITRCNQNKNQKLMKCCICMEGLKAECGGQETNWSQKCISCKDSWVCGDCYCEWEDLKVDEEITDPDVDIEGENNWVMKCCLCRTDMIYSKLVNKFNHGGYDGWWTELPPKLTDILHRNTDYFYHPDNLHRTPCFTYIDKN